ncbi:FtsW/RodA/SpoVE family cell cycle protein, partial [Phascolarctobacterium succinatutens]|uniref:FtsW/RodA/SpoVE family cell cycle protein n=1 Tax=Phascolarctobacterium succinatutens TaxID=626940 RepID=UPI0026EE29AF
LLSLVDISELMRKKGWLWLTLFGLGMILLLLVFGEAGDTGNLAWLDFPFLPFMVQPSEIVKLTFTVVLAWQLVWLQENRTLKKLPDVLFLGAHLMVFFLLYYKISSDMGSDLVFVAIFICMCFVAGVSKGWFIGGGLTLIATCFMGEGNILVMLWLLFILRMLNRSSGDRHRLIDNVIMIGSAAWLGLQGLWVFPLLTGAAYILESQIQAGYFRSLYLAGISLACLIFAKYDSVANELSMSNIIIMALAFILFLPEIRVADYVKSKGDKNGKRLLPKRLQTMQGYFCMMLFSLTFLHGNAIVPSLMPAVGAAAGCGIYLFVALLKHEVF